jgi:hypothetical protein
MQTARVLTLGVNNKIIVERAQKILGSNVHIWELA